MNRPNASEYEPFFRIYIAHVTEEDIFPVLRSEPDVLEVFLNRVPRDRETYRYADDKWSIREVVGHLVDTERVFGYRALCIARGDKQNLPGMDQNNYTAEAPYNQIELEDILSELRLVRLSNIAMFRNLNEEAWTRIGSANDQQVSVRALAFIMAGHFRHHMGLLRDRYLANL
jgi:hypothetical protein